MMKNIEIRRAKDWYAEFHHMHTHMSADIWTILKEAENDESPLAPIFSRVMSLTQNFFVEVSEELAKIPVLTGNMDRWGAVTRTALEQHWSQAELNRFDFLLDEYEKAKNAAESHMDEWKDTLPYFVIGLAHEEGIGGFGDDD